MRVLAWCVVYCLVSLLAPQHFTLCVCTGHKIFPHNYLNFSYTCIPFKSPLNSTIPISIAWKHSILRIRKNLGKWTAILLLIWMVWHQCNVPCFCTIIYYKWAYHQHSGDKMLCVSDLHSYLTYYINKIRKRSCSINPS